MNPDALKGQPLELPQINNWFFEFVPNFDKKLHTYNVGKNQQHLVILGDVANSKRFKDGTFIKTSYITEVKKEDNVLTVRTIQGETYLLLFPDSILELAKPRVRTKLVGIFEKLMPGEFADDVTKAVNRSSYK